MSVSPAAPAIVALTQIDCGNCGGSYAISERYRAKKAQEGGYWNCPYCQCSWGYGDNNENARLKRELELQKKRTAWAEQDTKLAKDRAARLDHSLRTTKGHVTRIKKRVSAGVCPCCKRTFKQLAAHMKTKHPTYGEDR